MKKIFVLIVLMVLFFILDNVLMPFLSIYGYYPNLLFVFVLCYSIINGEWDGLWIGIAAGAMQDIYFFNGFGINTFCNMITCIIAGWLGKNLFKEKSLIPITASFFLSALKGFMIFIILYILGQSTDIRNVVFNGVYNMVICMFMYKKVYKLCLKDYMKKDWNFD